MKPPSSNLLKTTQNGLKRDSACRLCRLHETADFVCLLGSGPDSSKGVVVGEAPGEREDDSGTPFVGRAGKLLDELLGEVGLDRDDLYITNAVHCRPPNNRTPTKSEIRKCSVWLKYELASVQPKVVLLLGGVALESVLGIKGIKKHRGQPVEKDGVIYLPAFHPAYVLRDETQRSTLRADLAKFKAMIEGGGLPKVKGLDYRIVRTRLDMEEMFEDLEQNDLFVYDVETTSLSPWHGKIVSIGFGTADKQWVVLVNHPQESLPPNQVDFILERIDGMKARDSKSFRAMKHPRAGGTGKLKSNHNGKFDALWMKVHFGVDWYMDFDTMLADYILDENKRHGLDICAGERYGAIDWDVPLEVKQGQTGSVDKHARYLALDLLYTYMLTEDLYEEIEQQPGLSKVFYHILMPASRMMVNAEFEGVYIDENKFNKTEDALTSDIAKAEIELSKMFPGVNWGSTQQVARILFDQLALPVVEETKGGNPSTSESVLKRLAPMHPIPALLMKRREASQQLSFFIKGWKPWLKRNRLHPSFKLHGTVTGRLSCENPNLQQVPRDPKIRSLIVSPPGWELVEADLSQIELRVAAELSGDKELMRCFQTGVDVHWRTMLSALGSDGGDSAEAIVQTSGMYLLQQGLSADERGAETLLAVFNRLHPGEKPSSLLQLCREVGPDQAARDWERQRSSAQTETQSNGSTPDKAKALLLALRQYDEVRTPPSRRSNQERNSVEFGVALQILSRLHPSDAEEIDKDWKERRKKAKAVGFGFLFGMWFVKFVEYARDNYGVIISEKDAKALRERFFELYSGLPPWHRKQRNFAHRNGYVRSMFGRKRRLPRAMDSDLTMERKEAERQAINSPVQSFASDWNLASALELCEMHSWSYFRVVGTVHDSILMYVRKDKLKEVVPTVLKVMSRPKLLDVFDIELRVPIEADVKIGPWSLGVSPEKYFGDKDDAT